MSKNSKCHPNLTEAEEQNYDIDPAKIRQEEEECLAEKKNAKTKQDKKRGN